MNKLALITGGTSGIGEAFARKLASLHYNLMITGRRKEKIEALAQELKTRYNVNVEVILVELADNEELARLVEKVRGLKNLDLLINNAGFGKRNNFHQEEITTFDNMCQVHMLALMRLTHAALLNMVSNKQGAIINVSSILAFYPFPNHGVYAATKAFVNLFSETISKELRDTGVKIQVLCPGMTITDFHAKLGLSYEKAYKNRLIWKAMRAEKVVDASLKALKKNKVICVPGILNKLVTILATFKRLF